MLWIDLRSISRATCGSTLNGSPSKSAQGSQVDIEQASKWTLNVSTHSLPRPQVSVITGGHSFTTLAY